MQAPNVVRPIQQWRDPRHRRGLAGEIAAARYLESAGWRIEAHRFRLGHHDIDLVARRGQVVAFVEVKARTSATFGTGAQSVGWRKRAILRVVAALWIARHGTVGEEYRFDLVEVLDARGFQHVSHIPDAWRDVEK
ncbi:MAG: YraN family protein [Gemmatimonadales bacterium]|nr:YraN family protein [Gemmatimonadales bacterium]